MLDTHARNTTTMIRKSLLFCKILNVKTSSKSLFDSYMSRFNPLLETCPICQSTGNCILHAYYSRSIADFINGHPHSDSLCVMRVKCSSCNHTHAILPDIIIPYRRYGLLFVLRVLGEYFLGLFTIEQLCERFDISENQFHKWLKLWNSHKREWLGLLLNLEQSNLSFLEYLLKLQSFSGFTSAFCLKFSFSFLQSHRNPRPPGLTARYRQEVFSPDIDIF